ncbi:MAG: hypothetical protein SPL31_06690 [Succinivibrio sp.]|nr:hypothetical protein [Succinivibrio sp.]
MGEVACAEQNKNFDLDVYSSILCTFVHMENETNKNKLYIAPSDYDKDAYFYDENGQPVYGVDIWCYCKFFTEHIQLRFHENGFDGLTLYEYADLVENKQKGLLTKLIDFNKDGNVYDFQMEMRDKYNVHINAWALCNLCMFIDKIVHRKLIVLLKPTIADTIEEIQDLDSITFTNKNGKSTTTRNKALIEQVKTAIKPKEEIEYEVERIADRQEVFTKELMQIEFFYYLSSFFQKFFPIKRRGLLTPAEMKMCGYFLKWFGLSAEVVTESRLRQFRMKFDVVNIGNISMLPINGEDVPFQWEFVKYKDWKNGKINPLKHETEHLQEGDSIIFPPDVAGLDLLKR